ncbi:MAG TPA: hypothetical protein ENI27_00060 [bacterium]|nr:hypothetical protein [bacterium]
MHYYTIKDQNGLIVRGVVGVPMILGRVTSLLVWGQIWGLGGWKAQLQKEAFVVLEGACGVNEMQYWVGLITLVLQPCWRLIPDGYGGWVVNPPVLYDRVVIRVFVIYLWMALYPETSCCRSWSR